MGSGKVIRFAIMKYGIENFSKEYLGIYDTEWKMNVAEKILVVIDAEVSYNLCDGGMGGFSYINRNKLYGFSDKTIAVNGRASVNELLEKRYGSDWRKVLSKMGNDACREKYNTDAEFRLKRQNQKSFLGKKHTEETKEKMRKPKNIGTNNASYGTCWITNDFENKKINKAELPNYIEIGYRLGRKMKF